MLLVCLRRVSSAGQIDGAGLARQSDTAIAYAKQRGWDLHPEPYSDEGVSGFSGANLDGDLGRFLKDLKQGVFGDQDVALGVEDLDRLSRQFSLAFLPVLVDDLLNAGVTLSVMGKQRDISAKSIKTNSMEMHELLFWMSAAHDYSAKLSGRIGDHRSRIRDRIRNGEPVNPGAAPAWISLVNGAWKLNEFAPVVRRVIEMAQAGDGCTAIARQLNADGVPSPGSVIAKRRQAAGGKAKDAKTEWHNGSVLQLLKSPALHGARKVAASGHNTRLREWKEACAHLIRQGTSKEALPPRPAKQLEEEQADYYPALLGVDEHQVLLAQIARRRTTDGMGRTDLCTWIGQRLTRCTCGASMVASSSSALVGKEKKRVYYRHLRCTAKRDGARDCGAPLTRLGDAEAHVLTRLSSGNLTVLLGLDPGTAAQEELASALTRRAVIATNLEALATRHQVGEDAITQASDPAVLGVLATRQAAVNAEIAAERRALLEVDSEIDRINRKPPVEEATSEATDAAAELLQTFVREESTPADRQRINEHLRRTGLTIHVDGEGHRIGLRLGSGEIDWQPINATARRIALEEGFIDPAFVQELPDGGVHIAMDEPVQERVIDGVEYAFLNGEWVPIGPG